MNETECHEAADRRESRGSWGFLLLGILILAAALRFSLLGEIPAGLFRDEADKGFSTYSLLQTGRDLEGSVWPLQIRSFGAYTSPFYHWVSLPFIAVFGLEVWGVRLTAALAGTLACGAVFLAGRRRMGWQAALLAAVLLAISPWHLLCSRWANQGILMTLFVPLAVGLSWKALDSEIRGKRPGGTLALAALCWALAWNSYAPSRMFVSLFLMLLTAVATARFLVRRSPAAREEALRLWAISLGTFILILPFLLSILLNWSETQTRLAFLVSSGEPLTLGRFIQNYLLHWDPRYLFLTGDGNPRHHIYLPLQGQLCWLESLGFLLGLGFLLFGGPPARLRLWLFSWLLLAPLPAALTNEGLPHALRTLMVVPGIALTAGYGLYRGVSLMQSKIGNGPAIALVGLVVLAQTGLNAYYLFADYPKRSELYWDAGFVEAIRTVEQARQEGEECFVTGMIEFPQAAVQFVTQPNPAAIQRGEALPGYTFLPTAEPFDPRRDDRQGLLLLRAWEGRKAPWWKVIYPEGENERMQDYWRLYRSTGGPGPQAPSSDR